MDARVRCASLFWPTRVLRVRGLRRSRPADHGDARRRRRRDQAPTYDVTVVSPRRRVTAAGGLAITTTPVGEADVLIVPGFELTQRLDLASTLSSLAIEVETIRRLHSDGVAIVSICVGAFLLGEAGLLDGRDSTTSWLFADELARRHPSTRVCPERLVVTDRGITTTAAFSAMYDFALGLVREHHGPDIARATARIALVDDARSTQTPYVDVDLLPTTGAGILPHVSNAGSTSASGIATTWPWCQKRSTSARAPCCVGSATRPARLRSAISNGRGSAVRRHLLESTDRSISSIAAQVGYHDASTFARLFARHVGRSPGTTASRSSAPPEPGAAGSPARAGPRQGDSARTGSWTEFSRKVGQRIRSSTVAQDHVITGLESETRDGRTDVAGPTEPDDCHAIANPAGRGATPLQLLAWSRSNGQGESACGRTLAVGCRGDRL